MMPARARAGFGGCASIARRALSGAACLVFLSLASPIASAQQAPAQEGWIVGTGVTLQTLDKITARIATTEMALSQPTRFGTLEITAYHCAYRPPEAPPETAAFLQIKDIGYKDKKNQSEIEAVTVFSGWMFASSPAISALEHPVYDVTVLACAK
jgi:hypothetical protein